MQLHSREPTTAANLKSSRTVIHSSKCNGLDAVQMFMTSPARLVNPYVQPVLYIRRPGDDYEETHRFPDDDPFFSEVSNLIDVIEDIEENDEEAGLILSTFEDACKTYEFTWAIRRASERSIKKKDQNAKPSGA